MEIYRFRRVNNSRCAVLGLVEGLDKMNELAGQTLGGYTLIEEVGRGSMGVVYRGKQLALGREVAIKVLPKGLVQDGTYVARFIREAQIIAGLNHPNIVHIYDAGQQKNLLYFVMEFVQGPTISSLLHLDGILPQHLASEYAAQIADALQAAYIERHVIHRDIKPENLMLDRWGKIKVMDFGLARATGLQQITVTKTLVGSLYYASPEQVWGKHLDNRSDIYALGVVLYEMVSGQRPFQGRSMPELTQHIIRGNPRRPGAYNPQLHEGLEQIILTALALDREHRYRQAEDMARELRNLHLPHPDTHLQRGGQTEASRPGLSPEARANSRMQPPRRPQHRPSYLDMPGPVQPSGEISRDALTSTLHNIAEEKERTERDREQSRPLEEIKTVPLELVKKTRGIWTVFRRFTRRA